MTKLEKMQIMKSELSSNDSFENFEIGNFRGEDVLAFDYHVLQDVSLRAFFLPSGNCTVLFLPTDDSMTDAQWKYFANAMNDMSLDGYQQGYSETLYDCIYDKSRHVIAVSFPNRADGEKPTEFDVTEQCQAIFNAEYEYIQPFSLFHEDICKDFKGRKPFPVKCSSNVTMLRSISSKDELLRQVSALFYVTAGTEDMDGSLFAVISTKEMSQMFNAIMEDYPKEKQEIMLGIKKFYSPSTWASLSEVGLRNFFEDLHISFVDACCSR